MPVLFHGDREENPMRTWLTDLTRWPVHSQRASRRNAHEAALELGQRRREREAVDKDVDQLLAGRRSAR